MRLKDKIKPSDILILLMPALLTLVVVLVLFCMKKYAPFGNNSLAWMDGSIQYLDIYSYFKDLIAGKNGLSYSFSKTLGGCMIAIFTYYLTSPFSLLALFFSKENLHSFFDITLMLKFMLAATTCNIFLMKRFEEEINKRYKRILIALLSFGYGLCQFNVAQCCNIMWIDGAYMLPLVLLSVFRVVRKNDFWKLSLTVGFTIIFNWYTGAINCLFSAFWLLVELLFFASDQPKGTKLKAVVNGIMKYAISMFFGVLIGGVALMPTLWALGSSGRGGFDWWLFRDRFILSPFYSIARNYYYGAEGSHYGGPALYVGALAAIGCLSAFVTDRIEIKKKLILAFAFVGCGLLFIVNPAFVVFSLFKNVGSGWFRYGYVGCLTIVFIAAAFFVCIESEKYLKTLIIGSVLCTLILLFPHELNFESAEMKQLLLTIFAILIIAVPLMFLLYSIKA
ncbi:MAG: YfhO family protein, partial [Lachnospiraceae bacterium]|nr:YfhO family protein [Lachnospiraceae bacterium]